MGKRTSIHAVLSVGTSRIHANAEDLDPARAVERVFDQLVNDAQVTVLAAALDPTTPADEGPWEEMYARIVAAAHHMVTRAVDLGDLPAGVIDPSDLADDALVGAFEDEVVGSPAGPTFRDLRARVATLLSNRIGEYASRAGDVELDRPVTEVPNAAGVEDEVFEYMQPDEPRLRVGDQLDDQDAIDDADRGLPVDPPTSGGWR